MTQPAGPISLLDGSAAVAGLALPVSMFINSRSAPLLLGLAALLALAGIWRQGRLDALRDCVLRGLSASWGKALAAVLIYFAASLAWTRFPFSGLFAFAELLSGMAGAMLLGACWTVSPPRQPGRWFAAGLIAGSALTIFDLTTDLVFRRWFGGRARTFVLNRTVVSNLLLFWPTLALLLRLNVVLAGAVSLLTLLAVWHSESGAALLGVIAGTLGWIGGRMAPRLTVAMLAAGTIAVLLVSPWAGLMLERALPAQAHSAMETMHSRDRVDIWRSYGAAVLERPVFGSGFNASARLAGDPVAKQVAEENRVLLGAGHPHNALLQVWVEGGVIGAMLILWLVIVVARRMMHLRGPVAAATCAVAASGLSIATVSHGAWQGWWIASIGLSIVLLVQALRERETHG